MKRLNRALADSSEDTYAALMLTHAHVRRCAASGKAEGVHEALDTLCQSMCALAAHVKGTEMTTLADMFATVCADAKLCVCARSGSAVWAQVQRVCAACDAAGAGMGVSSPRSGKVHFLHSLIRHESSGGHVHGEGALDGLRTLHLLAARDCAAMCSDAASSGAASTACSDAFRLFVYAGEPDEFARFAAHVALAWGYAREVDLFLARGALMLLSSRNLRDAQAFYDAYLARVAEGGRSESVDTPLAHFVKFTLLAAQREARPLWGVLCDKYSPSLNRDAALAQLVTSVGTAIFGVRPPPSPMDNIMGMLGGGAPRLPVGSPPLRRAVTSAK